MTPELLRRYHCEKILLDTGYLYLFFYIYHTQQGRQREPTVKRLCSPLFAEFRRHYRLSGGTQGCALPAHHSEEMEI